MPHKPDTQILRLLFWESTIRCNLSCAHCRRIDGDEAARSDLTTAQARTMIDQLAQLGREQPFMPILVFSGGEPLCRQDIFELIDYARNSNIRAALATNGTLVNETIARRIRQSDVARVSVSLDGATADVHDRLRRLDGSFEQALAGIRCLKDQGVPFQINITLTKHNAHQIEDVCRLAKSLGAAAVHVFMLVPVGCGQVLAETDILSPRQYEDMLVRICRLEARGDIEIKVTCGPHYERVKRQQGLAKSHTAAPGADPRGRTSRGCLAGLGVLFVSHQGDVFPCGYLPVNCGNILHRPLKTIWRTSPDLARLRDTDALEGKCGRCGYRAICSGCRARAFGARGNYMAEEPFCAYIPPEATR
ncbi:MAG TPA: radical SAM protein [Anaerohalosphaeraceae bacterium]|mgnify:CR=1 FL=1|jgi:radical SAM protein with 4Fe4S-binding SPASM domain|nr:radical SAM protein [Anaerohalosphaeraceae bacterium]HRT49509.1 radical SAM protein [Anaerohalosphaeraceae bacterium]HRT85329.1 radical SAM protein [Anaerohalosphaeraceae bacterium]